MARADRRPGTCGPAPRRWPPPGSLSRTTTAKPFHAGRSVDVLLYSDDPEVTVETVVETVPARAFYHHDPPDPDRPGDRRRTHHSD